MNKAENLLVIFAFLLSLFALFMSATSFEQKLHLKNFVLGENLCANEVSEALNKQYVRMKDIDKIINGIRAGAKK